MEKLLRYYDQLEKLDKKVKIKKDKIKKLEKEMNVMSLPLQKMKQLLCCKYIFNDNNYSNFEKYNLKRVLEYKCEKKLLEKFAIDIDAIKINVSAKNTDDKLDLNYYININNFVDIYLSGNSEYSDSEIDYWCRFTFYNGGKKLDFRCDYQEPEEGILPLDKVFCNEKHGAEKFYGKKYKYAKKLTKFLTENYFNMINPLGYYVNRYHKRCNFEYDKMLTLINILQEKFNDNILDILLINLNDIDIHFLYYPLSYYDDADMIINVWIKNFICLEYVIEKWKNNKLKIIFLNRENIIAEINLNYKDNIPKISDIKNIQDIENVKTHYEKNYKYVYKILSIIFDEFFEENKFGQIMKLIGK